MITIEENLIPQQGEWLFVWLLYVLDADTGERTVWDVYTHKVQVEAMARKLNKAGVKSHIAEHRTVPQNNYC